MFHYLVLPGYSQSLCHGWFHRNAGKRPWQPWNRSPESTAKMQENSSTCYLPTATARTPLLIPWSSRREWREMWRRELTLQLSSTQWSASRLSTTVLLKPEDTQTLRKAVRMKMVRRTLTVSGTCMVRGIQLSWRIPVVPAMELSKSRKWRRHAILS